MKAHMPTVPFILLQSCAFVSSSAETLPITSNSIISLLPKDRYKLMKAYMPTVGTMGLDMMFRTCTVQV